MALLPIHLIKVNGRFRKDLGDLRPLMDSIVALGLLHPVVVNADYSLIAGERRLAACTQLGWTVIPVPLVDLQEVLRAERDENVVRKDFLPSEAVALKRALELLEREKARQRQHEGQQHGGLIAGRGRTKQQLGEKFTPSYQGKTRDRVASYAGLSAPSLKRAEAVVLAAEDAPEKYADLLQEMDRTGRVAGVYRKLKVRTQAEELSKEPPPLPTGPFRVIVVDPPWHYGLRDRDPSSRSVAPYPTMSMETIKKLDVAALAADDCVLWLWTTNAHRQFAFDVLRAWGFQYETILTWVKNKMGTGVWLRGQSEQCLFARRGRPLVNLTNQTTIIHGSVREHSRKPEEFYQMVEALCPGSKVELFAREARPGWAAHGSMSFGQDAEQSQLTIVSLTFHSSAAFFLGP
jgi:N6-adenosine-specific RNA methylase IME4